jgi:hypothetical protein
MVPNKQFTGISGIPSIANDTSQVLWEHVSRLGCLSSESDPAVPCSAGMLIGGREKSQTPRVRNLRHADSTFWQLNYRFVNCIRLPPRKVSEQDKTPYSF